MTEQNALKTLTYFWNKKSMNAPCLTTDSTLGEEKSLARTEQRKNLIWIFVFQKVLPNLNHFA